MRLKNSIIAIAVLSSMSYAGGDIGGVTQFENDDYVNAEVEAVEPMPVGDVQTGEGEIIEEAMPVTDTTVTTTPPANQRPVVQTPKATPKKDTTPKKSVSSSGGFGELVDGLYLGIAVSDMAVRSDDCVLKNGGFFGEEKHQDRQVGITGVIGYNFSSDDYSFMNYLGAELRAALSVAEENDGQDNLAEYGVYLKAHYPVIDNLNVYGLVGYSFINMSDPATRYSANDKPFDGDNSGLSFGAGIDYGVTQNISVFTDVVNYLRDFDGSNSTWGANLGVKYHF